MNKFVALGSSRPGKKEAAEDSGERLPQKMSLDKIRTYRSRLSDANYMNHAIKKIAMELLHFLVKDK